MKKQHNTIDRRSIETGLKYVASCFVLIILAFLLGCAQRIPQITPQKEIVLGYLGPLTGEAAIYGETEKNAIELALKEINEAGGINGKRIRVIYEDGKCDGKTAVTAAQKLITIDAIKVILGGFCSGETLAVIPLTEEQKIILFSSGSSSPQISELGEYVFRNVPPDTEYARVIAAYLNKFDSIGIITEQTDYATALADLIKQSLPNKQITEERYAQNSPDMRTQLTKIKAQKPAVLFINSQTPLSAGTIVKQAKELLLPTEIVGSFVFSGTEAKAASGNNLNDVVYIDPPQLTSQKAIRFLQEYEQLFVKKPAHDYVAGARYDSVFIIANSIKVCGEETDCIKDYLYHVEDYNGVIGNYEFNEKGDAYNIKFIVKKIENDTVIELEKI